MSNDDSKTPEAIDVGKRMRDRFLGTDHTANASKPDDIFGQELVALAIRNVWDGVWARPGLDERTRSMCTINLLLAQGQASELELHFRGALRNKLWTVEELLEVCLHATAYCGFPRAREALMTLKKVHSSLKK